MGALKEHFGIGVRLWIAFAVIVVGIVLGSLLMRVIGKFRRQEQA